MTILGDIVPLTERVVVRGRDIEVRGITIEDIPQLFMRFPDLRGMLSANQLTVDAIARQSRELVVAMIASGIGQLGDKLEEAGIGNLNLGEQATLLAAVIRMTGGVGPFVELMATVGITAVVEPEPESVSVHPLSRGGMSFRKRSNGLSQSASTA